MIEKTVIDILSKQFGKEVGNIKLEMIIANDLAADSLDLMEIVMELESKFKIIIEDDEYNNSFTVQQIVDLIKKKSRVA
jgi:acyl carrier protein